jgi:hypothetical protein
MVHPCCEIRNGSQPLDEPVRGAVARRAPHQTHAPMEELLACASAAKSPAGGPGAKGVPASAVPPADAPRCAAYLPRKRRQCKMRPVAPSPFCFAHDTLSSASPTPRCQHCTTPVSRSMSHHISVCPAALRAAALVASPYHAAAINLPKRSGAADVPPRHMPRTSDAPPPARALADGLHASHARTIAALHVPASAAAPPPETAALRVEYADQRNSGLKYEAAHFAQNAALAGLLLTLTPEAPAAAVVVELGAGRAYTSLFLAQVLCARGRAPAAVVAVDSASVRCPADRALRALRSAGGPDFQRLRCDLVDLDIGGIAAVAAAGAAADVLFVGKHVCGSALDFSLVAMTRYARNRGGGLTFALASCCRHRCEWGKTAAAADVWRGVWNVRPEDFAALMKMAGWGAGCTDCEQDVETGRKVMELVDGARVLWLRQQGWDAHLVRYVDARVSPENIALVGKWVGARPEARANSAEVS